ARSAGRSDGDTATDIHAAIATATTDALCQHAAGTTAAHAARESFLIIGDPFIRLEATGAHIASDRESHVVATAAAATDTTDAQRARIAAATAAACDAGGNADAAIAAATTDGLRDDAVRVRARCHRVAAAHELDVVTVAAAAAEAAHADAG